MRSGKSTILATALALACCACAPLPSGQAIDWQHGAKRGWIAAVYRPEQSRATLPRCLADVPASELAQHRYVRIEYHHARRMLTEVAALPDELPLQIGGAVELWPQDCDQGKLSRIVRVLPSSQASAS